MAVICSKKKNHMFPYMIMVLLFILCLGNLTVYAAESGTATTQIPVSCVGTNTTEVFHYKLESVTPEAENAEVHELELKDGETGNFVISYTAPGAYHYTVSQQKGTDSATKYDTRVYQIDVYVTSNADGRLHATPVLYLQGETLKKETLEFQNSKESEPTNGTENKNEEKPGKPAIPQTGDEASLTMFIIIMLISGASIVLLWLKIKRKE